ncbi:amino acid adenylation domain-containing protein [Streptococcus suis]|nr:amino acid adenylation domain-containing protein [Streptococcus suis]
MQRSILDYLEKTEKKYPRKIAVIDESHEITYSDLLEKSKRIGSALINKVELRNPVMVLMEKSTTTLCSFFGIIYAGGFYVLVNPELPLYRIKQIQSVLQAKYIITDNEHMDLAFSFASKEIILNVEKLLLTDIDDISLTSVRINTMDTDPLYAIFTSGSTGLPKGVLVGHRSVIDFIDVFTHEFNINSSDIIGNQAPFDFDVSVKDIYSTIKTGATLVIIPKQYFLSPAQLLDFICNKSITTMTWAVSALCLISSFHGLDYRIPSSIKRILFSGEQMPLKHLKYWMEKLPNTDFVNLYGPTETTCNCTYYRVIKGKDYSNGIPIGKQFKNERVFLLDSNNKLITENGKIGELCVTGTTLAIGYYNNIEQTKASFCQNPLNTVFPEKIYRTGDLAKYNENGELLFCGRKDFQVKHMGHRIELEEIERVISNIDGVERLCAVYDHKKSKICGFYIGNISKKELFAKLKRCLPIYMIPSIFYQVSDFPITKNGKIDRKQLLEARR